MGWNISCPYALLDRSCQAFQNPVPGQVPVSIVKVLKAVYVNSDDRCFGLRTTCPDYFLA